MKTNLDDFPSVLFDELFTIVTQLEGLKVDIKSDFKIFKIGILFVQKDSLGNKVLFHLSAYRQVHA